MEINSAKNIVDMTRRDDTSMLLNREEFIQYVRGKKRWIFISLNSNYNETNIFSGKKIELKLNDEQISIFGKLGEVHIFDNYNQLLHDSNFFKLLSEESLRSNDMSSFDKKIDLSQKIAAFEVLSDLSDYSNKFVITGGPGFGKTTLIKHLEELGYNVFHEAARAIIEEQKKYDDPIFPWKDRIRFDQELIKKLVSDYKRHQSNVLGFYDRGIPDLIGWREYAELDSHDVKKLAYVSPYEGLVFLTKPWQEIYESNEDRPYSFYEASKINQILQKCYSNLGYTVEYLPNKDTRTRVEFVLEKISEYKK